MQNPKTSLMARVKGTGIYREESKIKSAAEDLTGIKIFRFSSSLCFFNVDFFKKSLYSKIGINPRNMTTETKETSSMTESEKGDNVTSSVPIHSIVIDCSMMAFIDIDGMQTLQTIAIECTKLGITVLFANASRRIQNTLKNSDVMNSMDQIRLDQMFVTLHDAVEYALTTGNEKNRTK
ncbi:sulfate anion transporter 1-like [Amphiura filiformis]|uniref:sulfate anion transporter 1-like n=1 Tax=Amphiura filiformis TaxID=82378 RepID=UPI003B210FC2